MSDEEDRRRTYAELEKRGQRTPGKYFGKSMPSMKMKQTPKLKVIDTTKMKQLKLLNLGGGVKDPTKDPLTGIAKMITNIEAGKTGIKTVDKQKKKDAILTKNLKKMAKRTKVKSAKSGLNITKPETFGIERNIIMPKLAKDGGLISGVVNMTKSRMVNPETGE